MKRALGIAARGVYVALSLYVLVLTLYHSGEDDDAHDYAQAMLLAMIILSFPAGLLVLLAYACLVVGLTWLMPPAAGHNVEAATLTDVVMYDGLITLLWLGFAGVGYYQWFKVIPRTLEKWKLPGDSRPEA